ncbi:MAG: SPASM domain-containing protein, partial [Candidatus Heimdallarchaeaceae archaeon]
FMIERKKLPILSELNENFKLAKKKAEEYGVELMLPAIYPIFADRSCSYVSAEATVIRSDGEVAPCFKYLYDHNSSLNQHERISSAYSFGNVFLESLEEIWNSKEYVKFRDRLNRFNEKIPYCGDCGLSSNNCFYATEDESDCYGNEPFCSECPYSLNITRCLI